MADSSEFAPLLHSLEKGVADHKEDKGGFTVDGVTLSTFRQFYGAHKTETDLRNISSFQWNNIMKSGYWDKCKADEIESQSLAELMVDWCVNSGLAAIRKVQEIVGCKPDGIVGPITLSLINTSDAEQLFERIWNARHQHYINIVKRNPSQKVFMNGWMNRLNSFKFEE
jgi:lysozyme family protein